MTLVMGYIRAYHLGADGHHSIHADRRLRNAQDAIYGVLYNSGPLTRKELECRMGQMGYTDLLLVNKAFESMVNERHISRRVLDRDGRTVETYEAIQ